jgi:hypothetical protein
MTARKVAAAPSASERGRGVVQRPFLRGRDAADRRPRSQTIPQLRPSLRSLLCW